MISFISFLTVLILSFNPGVKAVPLASGSPETMMNVPYGDDPKQKMDVYLPAHRTPDSTPLIVLIHGGGWNSGDKSQLTPYITALQNRLPDYAFANINYRLLNFNTGDNRFPAQENDVKDAIQFLRAKASDYKISKSIILLGASAGGHLALLQGYKNEKPEDIKAVISFFGPSDLIELYNHPGNPGLPFLLNALMGTNPAENKTFYSESSPINFVTPSSPPTLLLQGGRDILVPEAQSTQLRDKLKSQGVKHQYIFYPEEGHGWRGSKLAESFDKIAAFLKSL